jgi:hypothetical protein
MRHERSFVTGSTFLGTNNIGAAHGDSDGPIQPYSKVH